MLLVCFTSGSANAAIRGPQTLFQGGVLSQDHHTLYVISPENQVQAIQLHSGTPRWKSTEGSHPLFESKDKLITLSLDPERQHGFRAVGLFKKTGKTAFRTDFLELPAWAGISLNLNDLPGKSTELEVVPSGGELLLNWTARSHYWGGAPPPRCVLIRANRSGHGTYRLNLATGKALSAVFVEDPIPPCDDNDGPFPGRRHLETDTAAELSDAGTSVAVDSEQVLFEGKWQSWIFKGILKVGSGRPGFLASPSTRNWWTGGLVELKAFHRAEGIETPKAKWSVPFTFYKPLIPPP